MYLEKINNTNDLKRLSLKEKEILAKEIRNTILEVVAKNGGHLASNLGVVELTIALYSCLNLTKDKVVWDVGHQTYVHKLLTGRLRQFKSLRQFNGLAGFPRCKESSYDLFNTGHSSTSISLALGLARARDIKGDKEKVVAIIGDGALTGGMSLEALNDAGISKNNLIIILNDNEMSISKNKGGLSKFLSNLRTRKIYIKANNIVKKGVSNIPFIGKYLYHFFRTIKRHIKSLFIKNMYFEDIGFTYLGPVNGHSIKDMEEIFNNASNISGPILIHVITKKGKGYSKAEKNPERYHAIGPFDIKSGESLTKNSLGYSQIMGKKLLELAQDNKKIVAITAAMEEGTGLLQFAQKYPNRFFDVEIAEEHALTMAAGMAKNGMIPVVPIYSSFLQRAYDQLLHDICLNNLHVVLCVDRSGNTGNDGETHHGIYDLSYLSTIPNLTILAPMNFFELEAMLEYAVNYSGPIAIRYPKGSSNYNINVNKIRKNKAEIIQYGDDLTILAVGKMVEKAVNVAKKLQEDNINAEVINVRFIKPLDIKTITESYHKTKVLVTMEDNDKEYGFGEIVKSYFNQEDVLSIGYPNVYLPHGKITDIEKKYHLDEQSLYQEIREFLNRKNNTKL